MRGSRGSKAKARPRGIKDAIVSIEEYIAVNVLASASNRLNTTKARATLGRGGEVNQRTRDCSHVVANCE